MLLTLLFSSVVTTATPLIEIELFISLSLFLLMTSRKEGRPFSPFGFLCKDKTNILLIIRLIHEYSRPFHARKRSEEIIKTPYTKGALYVGKWSEEIHQLIHLRRIFCSRFGEIERLPVLVDKTFGS